MFRFLLFVSCLCLCEAASVTRGNYCCTLPQYEGTEGAIGGYTQGGRGHGILAQVFVSYDRYNRRIAATTNTTMERTPVSVKTILDYNTNTQYSIDLYKRKCQKTKITQPFNDGCIPDDATRYGEFVMGFGDNKLVAENYALNIKQAKTQMFVTISVTPDSCMPVSETFQGTMGEVSLSETIGFTGLTKGIKDPAVFTPPAYCSEPSGLDYEVINPVSGFRIFGI